MTVVITYPHAHRVSHNFTFSLLREVRYTQHDVDIQPQRCYPGDDLAMGRNRSVSNFLETDASHLWTLDTDMGVGAGALDALAARCTPATPVVSALYRVVHEHGDDGMGAPEALTQVPAAYAFRDGGMIETYTEYSDGMAVEAVGAGCMMLHRSVLEQMRERYYGPEWFTCYERDGVLMGEDISFCGRLREMEVPIILDTTVPTTHHKAIWVRS